jgi:phage terminase large subunit-like protein
MRTSAYPTASRISIPTFAKQAEAIYHKAPELLIGGSGRCGASHTLRLIALRLCLDGFNKNLRVVLAQRRQVDLRINHIEGPGGLLALCQRLRNEDIGLVRDMDLKSATFSNNSTITWLPFDTEAEQKRFVAADCDVLLIDDAEEMSPTLYELVRQKALASIRQARRVVCATREFSGWLYDHFAHVLNNRHRAILPMSSSDISPELAKIEQSLSFADWIGRAMPSYNLDFPHAQLLVDTMQEVVDGKIKRLLIQGPPRVGKSTPVTRLASAYFLYRYPKDWVGIVTGDDRLALGLSKDAREAYAATGGIFLPDANQADMWRTRQKGGLWARSLGQQVLGHGFTLGLIDDPFGSWAHAQRPSIQAAADEYFWRTFYNRRNLHAAQTAAIVVNHQRMHEHDLIGRLLERERERPSEHWHILDLPIRKVSVQVGDFPASCTLIDDKREPGDLLCPDLIPEREVLDLERRDALSFQAMYQQRPMIAQSGGLFEAWWWPCIVDPALVAEAREKVGPSISAILEWLVRYGHMPRIRRQARAWDYAATEGAGDFTAGVRGLVLEDERVVFVDAFAAQLHAASIEGTILEMAERDGRDVEVILPQDPAATGKILATDWRMKLDSRGFRTIVCSNRGSKWTRALPHAGAAKWSENGSPGRCYVLPGDWVTRWASQHHAFDGVSGPDDQVDASAYLFNEIGGQKTSQKGMIF